MKKIYEAHCLKCEVSSEIELTDKEYKKLGSYIYIEHSTNNCNGPCLICFKD